MLTGRRLRQDAGFTLVELLMSIVILGIIAVPLGEVVIGYLKNADATTTRLSQSHDAQMAASYFAQDVQAVGVRDYTVTGSAFFPLKPSVERNVGSTAGLYPCGPSTLPNAVVRLAWDDFPSGAAAPPVQARVAYVVENGSELHRVYCAGSSAVTSDVRIATNLVSATATCSTACDGAAPAPTVPSSVNLALTIQGFSSPVTLTGQRRQS